jgi:hypothetical protein
MRLVTSTLTLKTDFENARILGSQVSDAGEWAVFAPLNTLLGANTTLKRRYKGHIKDPRFAELPVVSGCKYKNSRSKQAY